MKKLSTLSRKLVYDFDLHNQQGELGSRGNNLGRFLRNQKGAYFKWNS